MIGRDGSVFCCAEDEAHAWHAGKSVLDGRGDVNTFSSGIEPVGFATGSYTASQIDAVIEFCTMLRRKYPAIDLERIVGHEDIAIPPGRKTDPGKNFPWSEVRDRIRAGGQSLIV